jgi:crotonobetainyl-CoA:carnitine CoA-transferase CaiB-like acyl-CoA transferase
VAHRSELIAEIESAFASDGAEVWLKRLDDAGVPAGKVRSLDDVYAWEQTRSQGLLIEVEHPTAGPIRLPGPPLRFDDNSYAGGREQHLSPPLLGQHDASVRAWLDEVEAAQDGEGAQP